jgi:hypothetical protein
MRHPTAPVHRRFDFHSKRVIEHTNTIMVLVKTGRDSGEPFVIRQIVLKKVPYCRLEFGIAAESHSRQDLLGGSAAKDDKQAFGHGENRSRTW